MYACTYTSHHVQFIYLLTPDAWETDRSNDEGIGPLHAAAASGNEAAVKLLLDKGADSLLQATDGRCAFDLDIWSRCDRLERWSTGSQRPWL